ncbi:MAG TPA: hypothetical protein VGK48_02430 [Terriglobia bacterium]
MKSWPAVAVKPWAARRIGGKLWPAYGLSDKQMMEFRGNPVDYAEQLAGSRIPLLNVVCRKDQAVPPAENTEVLAAPFFDS